MTPGPIEPSYSRTERRRCMATTGLGRNNTKLTVTVLAGSLKIAVQ